MEREYRKLADAEIERQLKRGEYRAAIAHIRQLYGLLGTDPARRQASLQSVAVTCALLVSDPVMAILGLAVFVALLLGYSQVRRTGETIERLSREMHGGA